MLYVMIFGIYGFVWMVVIKDIMMFVVIGFLGIYLFLYYYGGYGLMFEVVNIVKLGFLKFFE